MERSRPRPSCCFRCNVVMLLVVAMCLDETTSITKNPVRLTLQVKDQRSPKSRRSLVAMVLDRSDLNTIPTGSAGTGTSENANPSTGATSNVGETSRPKPGETKPNQSVLGENESVPMKPSIREALHLPRKGQIPVKIAHGIVAVPKRDTFARKQGATDVGGSPIPGANGLVSELDDRGTRKNARRVKRQDSGDTSSSPSPANQDSQFAESSSESPSSDPPASPSPSQSLPEDSLEASMADPTTPSDRGASTTVTISPLPGTTSVRIAGEQVQTTSHANPVSTGANGQPTTMTTTTTTTTTAERRKPSVVKTRAPTSVPQRKVSSKPITTVLLHTTASPTTNATGDPVESKIQDVRVRTPDSDCGDGNCDSAVTLNRWTSDAYWACGSLLTILLLLTVAVLYTGLWRKRNHMSNPISDLSCHTQASPSRKSRMDIKDLLKMKLRHIRNLNSSPLSTLCSPRKQSTRQHNGGSGGSKRSSNGRAGNRYPHRYDRLPLLAADGEEEEEEEEFSKEWGPQTKEHSV